MSTTVTNLNFASQAVSCRSGNSYIADTAGTVTPADTDLRDFYELGFLATGAASSSNVTTALGFTPATATSVTALTPVDPGIATPLSAATVAITPVGAVTVQVIAPSGLIAALTVTIANGTAGQVVFLIFTQVVTALTLSGGNFNASPALPTATTALLPVAFVWSAGLTKWVRFI